MYRKKKETPSLEKIIYDDYHKQLRQMDGDELLKQFDLFTRELNQLIFEEETRGVNRRKRELEIGLQVIDDIMNEAGEAMSAHTMTLELKKDTFEQEQFDLFQTQKNRLKKQARQDRKGNVSGFGHQLQDFKNLAAHPPIQFQNFQQVNKSNKKKIIQKSKKKKPMGCLTRMFLDILVLLFLIIIIIWLLPENLYIPSFVIPGTNIWIDGNSLTEIYSKIHAYNPF